MTGTELLKAACCNLSESFETNPSVDVSYNDAVTGSKQIQLLGLSGNYTQLTVENLPGPRGIATPLGLNLSLIHISEPTRRTPISYAVFCLKKFLLKI